MTERKDYLVRPTRREDIEQITGIYALEVATGRASFEVEPPDTGQMHSRFESICEGGYTHLVACRGDEILAYAYTSSYRPRIAYRFTVEDSVYVRRDVRGGGIASALLNALIEDSRRKSFRQMIAVIGDSANTSSIALHRKLGFREVGVLRQVGYKFEEWLDTVLMQRSLLD